MEPSHQYFAAAAVGFILGTLALLALGRGRRKVPMDRRPSWLLDALSWWLAGLARGRRSSDSQTPPRSTSPEKKLPSIAPATTGYKNTFPPSPRENLCDVAESMPESRQKLLKGLSVDQCNFRQNLIPFTADYRECESSIYTPMEISIEEVKALGDFPDYAKLSGVPLPEPYREFDIERAIAKPYRPFRWLYTQNMCRSPGRPIGGVD
ncbi:MAG: hypothetical protein Q9217_006335 [Psora testacea]